MNSRVGGYWLGQEAIVIAAFDLCFCVGRKGLFCVGRKGLGKYEEDEDKEEEEMMLQQAEGCLCVWLAYVSCLVAPLLSSSLPPQQPPAAQKRVWIDHCNLPSRAFSSCPRLCPHIPALLFLLFVISAKLIPSPLVSFPKHPHK